MDRTQPAELTHDPDHGLVGRCHDCDEVLTDETVYYVKVSNEPEQAYCDQCALWHTTGEPDRNLDGEIETRQYSVNQSV